MPSPRIIADYLLVAITPSPHSNIRARRDSLSTLRLETTPHA
jgi:hypothetical protein